MRGGIELPINQADLTAHGVVLPSWTRAIAGYVIIGVASGLANGFRSADLDLAIHETIFGSAWSIVVFAICGCFWFFGGSRVLGGRATFAESIRLAGGALFIPYLLVFVAVLLGIGLVSAGMPLVNANVFVGGTRMLAGLYGYASIIKSAHEINHFTPVRTVAFACIAFIPVFSFVAVVFLIA